MRPCKHRSLGTQEHVSQLRTRARSLEDAYPSPIDLDAITTIYPHKPQHYNIVQIVQRAQLIETRNLERR